MKKIIITLACATLALSACTMNENSTQNLTPSGEVSGTKNTPSKSVVASGTVVSLNYTLHTDSAKGKVIETTVESIAKSEGLYQSGAKYQPYQVLIGATPAQVIPGFEKGLLGMKVGEKKTIEVIPSEGYGESTTSREFSKYEIAPTFTVTLDKSKFQDKISETVNRSMLGEDGANVRIGQTLTGGNAMTAIVRKIDGDMITLEIENKNHPFYGKKFAVGTKVSQDGFNWTIKSINGTGATFDIENTNSPFYGKKFAVGSSVDMPTDPTSGMTQTGTITIESMSGETVVAKLPNPHPLGGKTLYFDIEVTDIK